MCCPTLRELPAPTKDKTGWPWTKESERLPDKMPDGRPWPKISIVTPSYNQGQFIEETIRSVLLQGYPNLEYIIIDGGSTDNSVEIIKRYSPQLTYWVSAPDNGHGNALNKGFSLAKGEIMAWINSDDKYLPWTFSVVAEIFNSHKNINWITGLHSRWDAKGRQIRVNLVYKNIYNFILGDYGWVQQESVFWRRSLWEKAGSKINEKYKFMVDGELWCRFFTLDDLWHVNCVLGGYRVHNSNRATAYYEQVINEMDVAVSELRRNSSAEVKRNVNFLKCLKKVKTILKFIKTERVAQKVFKNRYQNINYKGLFFNDGKWVTTTHRFML